VQDSSNLEISSAPSRVWVPSQLKKVRYYLTRVVLLIVLSFELCAAPQSQEQRVGLRLIAVRTESEAANLRSQLQAGAPFEVLAREHSTDASASAGGYIGLFRLADLRPELQRAINGLKPGQISAVTPADGQFFLLQRLSPEEAEWSDSNNSGVRAFRDGRYEEAAQSFRQAIQYAEKLTPVDYRLEDSLHGLAETYRLQKKYPEAEPFYRRYLAIHWGGASAPEVLDRFSALVALAYFRDSQFEEVFRKFDEAVNRAPLSEELYEAMSGILFKAQLMPEAEMLLVRAARLFPASRDVHYHLGQLYLAGQKTRQALEVFEQLSRMKAPASIDPAVDRLQQSVAYQKIGSIRAQLAEFDQALSAYRKALDLTPDSAESRVGLGDVYLQQGKLKDALAEYERVALANPESAAAYFRIADAHLRIGDFPEALAAAARTLTIDPAHRRAHYVQATALVRMGRTADAEKELELYRKLEAETRSDTDRSRSMVVLNRGAAAKFLEGHAEEAIEMFRKIIESYPDAPAHYLNLGTAQSKLGRHKEAAETFQKMLTLGMADNFLVYRNLAQEYKTLGNVEASHPYEVVYLQNLDVALREALESNLE
jgi:tetratricopeptide (TPR) repeat protein